ncbi:GIY-YIG nuclease family protein [Deinococcus pimensis]|uniref:GIY-YIG nuclease family protein n=1 Tax=Deinococcus pimensis TaxID=309888 RepID=UPI0004BB2CD9|nr:GIY-YIG nuclease family protein [Deinococcus pimensis]
MNREGPPALFAPDRPYKDFEPVMGVWSLRNTINGRRLVGASLHTAAALNRTLFTLRHGQHRNRELQRDWNEHGEAAFVSEVLHVLEPTAARSDREYADELATLERLCLDELRPWDERGYHTRPARR